MTLDFYGFLPIGRGGVKYLLVCLEVFSKHVTLYPLKSANTRSCLNKLVKHYLTKVVQPQIILTDHGSQFTSARWKKTLTDLGILIKYTPIRHPASNPTERIMRELGKYFRIYCEEAHKKWPELVPYIQNWLNSSITDTIGYAPVELLGGNPRPDIFHSLLKKYPDQTLPEESLTEKIIQAYARTKLKAEKRRLKRKDKNKLWNAKPNDLVLIRKQHITHFIQGINSKFNKPYEGPFMIKK